MGTNDPMRQVQKFIRGPVMTFAKEQGKFLAQEMRKRDEKSGTDRTSRESVNEYGVVNAVDELVGRARLTDALSSLKQHHDANPVLQPKGQQITDLAKKYETVSLDNIYVSGMVRYAFLLLHGCPEDRIEAEVAHGYDVVLAGKKTGLVLGATLPSITLEEELRLDERVSLRPLTDIEHGHVYPKYSREYYMMGSPPASVPAIVLTGGDRKVAGYLDVWPGIDDRELTRVRSAIAFVQLLAGNGVRPHRLFAINTEWLPNVHGDAHVFGSAIPPGGESAGGWPKVDDKAAIQGELASKLQDQWPKYQAALSDARFLRACSRFSLSLQRESPEDALIDHWIGLESLFGAGDREISRTVASKMAILLERTLPKRKTLRDQVLKHYAIRSALVHGGDVAKRLKEFRQSIADTVQSDVPGNMATASWFSRKWLRLSLRHLTDHSEALNELDDALISGLLAHQTIRLGPLKRP